MGIFKTVPNYYRGLYVIQSSNVYSLISVTKKQSAIKNSAVSISCLISQPGRLEAVAPILAADEDAVCVIHGGVIACLMFCWFPGKAFNDWMLHPGTGWQVTVENGKPVSYVAAPFVPV